MRYSLLLLMSLSLACFLGCSDDDDDEFGDIQDEIEEEIDEEIDDEEIPECVGTWTITSAVLDGEEEDVFGAVWTISPTDWALQTVICGSTGTTDLSGEDISMTVATQNCADPIPAPEGRTASGTCSVENGVMTMTLSHDLEGTVHTLTVTGEQQ